MNIITNNVPRKLIYGYELPKKVRADFDYIDSDIEFDNQIFVFYRGNYYDISQFTFINDPDKFKNWNGYINDTAFSGTLIKLINDEYVLMGRYYS